MADHLSFIGSTGGSGWIVNHLTGEVCGPDGKLLPGRWWNYPHCAHPVLAADILAMAKNILATYPEFKIRLQCVEGGPAIELRLTNDSPEGDTGYRDVRINVGYLAKIGAEGGYDSVRTEIFGRLGYQVPA